MQSPGAVTGPAGAGARLFVHENPSGPDTYLLQGVDLALEVLRGHRHPRVPDLHDRHRAGGRLRTLTAGQGYGHDLWDVLNRGSASAPLRARRPSHFLGTGTDSEPRGCRIQEWAAAGSAQRRSAEADSWRRPARYSAAPRMERISSGLHSAHNTCTAVATAGALRATPDTDIAALHAIGEHTPGDLVHLFGVGHSTVYRTLTRTKLRQGTTVGTDVSPSNH